MSGFVVATGTLREARTLDGMGLTVIAGGSDPAGLARRLESVGASALVSFGMAGGLAPDLAIGDWIVGERVSGAETRDCDPALVRLLNAALPGARIGAVHADGHMVQSVAEKQALFAAGAVAVDMESHLVARVAAARGLPFAIVRCISDPADRALPAAVAVAMRPDGRVDVGAVLGSLMAQPRQVGALVATGLGFARAMRALERGARAIGLALT